jgi:hypothetical protein
MAKKIQLITAEKDGRTKTFTPQAWALIATDDKDKKNGWARIETVAPEPPEAKKEAKVSIADPPEASAKVVTTEAKAEVVTARSPLPPKAKAKAKKK